MTRRTEHGTWARHFQAPWHDDASNPRFPLPLRVAFLAYGTHRANGHAVFKKGEVAKILGHLDENGHPVPADRRTVWRAIQHATEFGLLAEGSKALCLIVPSHRIKGGMGDEYAPCSRHPKNRTSTAPVVVRAQRTTAKAVVPKQMTTAPVVESRSGSLSSQHLNPTADSNPNVTPIHRRPA